MTGRRIAIHGTVQGVGFRPWVYRLARDAGITGRVRNDARGVTIEAFGSEDAMAAFLGRVESEAPPAARLQAVQSRSIPHEPGATGFVIEESGRGGPRRVSIPADLATCDDCLRELFDHADRRYRYPFINCTACGPRYTILRDVPYDRAATTMAAFTLCADCRREYEDPADRRFHAEPNACPECGPRYHLHDGEGWRLPALDPLATAAAYLADGMVVAVKGIGGFHLACDATRDDAVALLRQRKRRAEKPFAVMVRNLAAAEEIAEIGEVERALLRSVERPIVLLRRRPDTPLAGSVAPGNPLVGVMLPYSPAHHLLLASLSVPLVMTSGNLAEEPIAFTNDGAFETLRGVADAFLFHDRDIAVPCDDSVAEVIDGGPAVIRRSRGHVPYPLVVATPFDRVVLACGGQLKNTFAVGVGDAIHVGPHVGDLDSLPTADAFERGVEGLLRMLKVNPEIVAHDLHPGYVSTAYALAHPAPLKVGVQHHHAHLASALAEHRLLGPVLGLTWDGTGHGADGSAWGGELLWGDAAGFERVATLRPIRLPGGEAAIRDVWRIALALLDDAYEGRPPLDRLSLFRSMPAREVTAVRHVAGIASLAPLAHGAGRYFDALGAIGLARAHSAHEGQVALLWNLAADACEPGRYPFALDRVPRPWIVDLRPMVRAAVDELVRGVAPGTVSARFHNTLAAAGAAAVEAAVEERGPTDIVLTGGCFANRRLAEGLRAALPGRDVYLHRRVPPGDGGLAAGQALVAAAVAREGRRSPCA